VKEARGDTEAERTQEREAGARARDAAAASRYARYDKTPLTRRWPAAQLKKEARDELERVQGMSVSPVASGDTERTQWCRVFDRCSASIEACVGVPALLCLGPHTLALMQVKELVAETAGRLVFRCARPKLVDAIAELDAELKLLCRIKSFLVEHSPAVATKRVLRAWLAAGLANADADATAALVRRAARVVVAPVGVSAAVGTLGAELLLPNAAAWAPASPAVAELLDAPRDEAALAQLLRGLLAHLAPGGGGVAALLAVEAPLRAELDTLLARVPPRAEDVAAIIALRTQLQFARAARDAFERVQVRVAETERGLREVDAAMKELTVGADKLRRAVRAAARRELDERSPVAASAAPVRGCGSLKPHGRTRTAVIRMLRLSDYSPQPYEAAVIAAKCGVDKSAVLDFAASRRRQRRQRKKKKKKKKKKKEEEEARKKKAS